MYSKQQQPKMAREMKYF